MTRKDAEEIAFNYGMMVSAMHDPRYYNSKCVKEARATPDTCDGNNLEALQTLYGDNWRDFWGKDYVQQHPEQFITLKGWKEVSDLTPQQEIKMRAEWLAHYLSEPHSDYEIGYAVKTIIETFNGLIIT